jgi:hypothetical protein
MTELEAEVQRLRTELERVKEIAVHRLEVLANRTVALTMVNPKLAVEISAQYPLSSDMMIHGSKKE